MTAHEAAWSRDGQRIAYFSGPGFDLYTANPDGSDPRKLVGAAGNGLFLRWSPDNKVVRFTLWDSAMPTLSVREISAGGRSPRRLLAGWREAPTHFSDGESGGDWTPDRKYFVFRSTRAGVSSIWALPERGNGLHARSRAPVLLTTTDSSLQPMECTGCRKQDLLHGRQRGPGTGTLRRAIETVCSVPCRDPGTRCQFFQRRPVVDLRYYDRPGIHPLAEQSGWQRWKADCVRGACAGKAVEDLFGLIRGW